MKMRAFVLLFLLSAIGCTTGPHHGEVVYNDIPKPVGTYDEVLARWTDHEKNYNAFSSTFQITASLLSGEVIEQQAFIDAQIHHWTSDELREARQKALSEAQTTTSCFVSFYTARDETNNLDKKDSTWNIFLESGGKHVAPLSIKRLYDSPVVLVTKYPYINVWSRMYLLKFPISTSIVTGAPLTLTVAGPAGDAHLHFPVVQ